MVEAVKHGVAAGTANTLVIGAGQFKMADFADVLSQVTVDGVETAVQ